MTNFRAHPEAGLTLLELLVVLALLGLLGGLAAAGLRSASDGWQRVVLYDSDSDELIALERMVRQLFSRAFPQKLGSWSLGRVRFSGDSARVEFLAALAQRFGAEDIVLYTINFPGDGTLHIVWRLDRDSPSGRKSFAADSNEEVLPAISEGAFSYFGTTEDGSARWQESWQNQPTLPKLIRMRFFWRGRPEEFIVAPLLTAGPCAMVDSDLSCAN